MIGVSDGIPAGVPFPGIPRAFPPGRVSRLRRRKDIQWRLLGLHLIQSDDDNDDDDITLRWPPAAAAYSAKQAPPPGHTTKITSQHQEPRL